MSEGNFRDGTKEVSEFEVRKEEYLSRVSEGAFRDGTERVSNFEFEME